MKKTFILILVLAMMLVSATALADTLYYAENFDSYPDGSYPVSFEGSFSLGTYWAEVVDLAGDNWFFIEHHNPTVTDFGASFHRAALVINPSETKLTAELDFMSPMDANCAKHPAQKTYCPESSFLKSSGQFFRS